MLIFRGFIGDDMLCSRVDRTGGCCSAWSQPSTAMPRLLLRSGINFSCCFVPPLSFNCTSLMSWHLFFQFTAAHCVHHLFCHALVHSFFLSFFFFHPVRILLAFKTFQKVRRNGSFLFFFSLQWNIFCRGTEHSRRQRSLSHISFEDLWYAKCKIKLSAEVIKMGIKASGKTR